MGSMMPGKGRNKLPWGSSWPLQGSCPSNRVAFVRLLDSRESTMLADKPTQPLFYAVIKEGDGNCARASLLNIIPPARPCLV